MPDDNMLGPGSHENVAIDAVLDEDPVKAQTYALLAISSAINRLADVLESRES